MIRTRRRGIREATLVVAGRVVPRSSSGNLKCVQAQSKYAVWSDIGARHRTLSQPVTRHCSSVFSTLLLQSDFPYSHAGTVEGKHQKGYATVATTSKYLLDGTVRREFSVVHNVAQSHALL